MASPQIENGYTKIANEILEALARIRIPGEAVQVLLTIIRLTYGFQKKKDSISLSQFYLKTGIAKSSIIRAIRTLEKLNLIYKKVNGTVTEYSINKDFETWKPFTKKSTFTFSSTNVYKKVKKRLLKSNLQKKKEKRKEDVSLSQEKDTRIKTLVDYFFTICREREEEPEKVLPKDCALLKTRLGQYTEEQIKFMLDFYLKSEKARNNGLSIAVALSNHSIGEYSNKGRWFYEG